MKDRLIRFVDITKKDGELAESLASSRQSVANRSGWVCNCRPAGSNPALSAIYGARALSPKINPPPVPD